jgi:hypothetical protein
MKTGAVMLIERVEQRVLGALRLIDRVSQTPLTRALHLTSSDVGLVRNMRGYYVVIHAAGLEAHTAAFLQPPALPALGANSCSVEINDLQKRYLPRLVTLRLPRDPNPANIANANSLFRPIDVAMYPATTAALLHNWSTLRASVTQGSSHLPVRGALLQVIAAAENSLLASGISDARGEALVIVPGVPVTKFADDSPGHGGGRAGGGGRGRDEDTPVVVNTLPVRLELSLGTSTPWPVDPDVLEQNHTANRRMAMDLTLSTGRMEKVAINLT